MAVTPQAPAPFIAPVSGSLIQQMSQVAQAINKKADTTSTPTYAAIHLIAPDGSTWMVQVTTSGALTTTQMPR